jgi:hypothetical protein
MFSTQRRPARGSVEEAAARIELLLDREAARKRQTGRANKPPRITAAEPIHASSGLMGFLSAPQPSGPTVSRGGDDWAGSSIIPVIDPGLLKHCNDMYEKCDKEDWGGDWTCNQCHFYCTGSNAQWPFEHCSPDLPRRFAPGLSPAPLDDMPPPSIPPLLPPALRPRLGGGGGPLPIHRLRPRELLP